MFGLFAVGSTIDGIPLFRTFMQMQWVILDFFFQSLPLPTKTYIDVLWVNCTTQATKREQKYFEDDRNDYNVHMLFDVYLWTSIKIYCRRKFGNKNFFFRMRHNLRTHIKTMFRLWCRRIRVWDGRIFITFEFRMAHKWVEKGPFDRK